MINGRFYFIQTENGNLIGEYSNQTSHKNVTESADMLQRSGDFVGFYDSSWFEESDREAVAMRLSISPKRNTGNRIFELSWTRNEENLFRGEGFIVNNMLIGNYWDAELHDRINLP